MLGIKLFKLIIAIIILTVISMFMNNTMVSGMVSLMNFGLIIWWLSGFFIEPETYI